MRARGWLFFIGILSMCCLGLYTSASAQVDYNNPNKGIVKIQVQKPGNVTDVGAGIVVRVDNTIVHEDLDIALLVVEPKAGQAIPADLPPFTLGASAQLQLGNVLSMIGHPLGLDWQPALRANTVQRLSDHEDFRKFRFTKSTIDKGNSGGPVFDEQGHLIGMVLEIDSVHAIGVKMTAALDLLGTEWGIPTTQLAQVASGGGQGVTATPVITAPSLPPGMKQVPAGEFWMGCNEQVDTECDDDDKSGRKVYLETFFIDRYEVSVADYRRCVTAGKCTNPRTGGKCNWDKTGRDTHPVNCVDWQQAKDYCQWAGKRLPTEAEWEKAARGADGAIYPWGNEWDASKANTDESGIGETVAVGSYATGVSPYGVYDMAGNVWEWVADWYAEDYYKQAPAQNPEGPETGQYRSLRGGGWVSLPWDARAANRDRNPPASGDVGVGFRSAQ